MSINSSEILSLIGFIPTTHQADTQALLCEQQPSLSLYSLHGITAVYSKIAINEMPGKTLEEMFTDLAILTPYLCNHEKILEKIMCYSPVFPVQFGTFFSSLLTLQQQMSKHCDSVNRALLKVINQEEWSIKGYLEQAKAVDKFRGIVLQEQQEQLINIPPGARYLKEQQLCNEIKSQLSIYMQPICQAILQRLLASITAFCERQIVQTNSVNNKPLLFNWAVLVANKKLAEFHESFNQMKNIYSDYGLHFSLTGPWPPYSFCRFESSF